MLVFIFMDSDENICSINKNFQAGLENALNNLCGVGFTKQGEEYFIYDNFNPSRLIYKGKLTCENLDKVFGDVLQCYPREVLD